MAIKIESNRYCSLGGSGWHGGQGTQLRALVTGYFWQLCYSCLIHPLSSASPLPFPQWAKAGDSLYIFKEDKSPLTQLSWQRPHRQVSGPPQAFGRHGWLTGWLDGTLWSPTAWRHILQLSPSTHSGYVWGGWGYILDPYVDLVVVLNFLKAWLILGGRTWGACVKVWVWFSGTLKTKQKVGSNGHGVSLGLKSLS